MTTASRDLIFAVCHIVALGSACANPVLYGWLNDNFRREFVAVLCRRCVSGDTPRRQRSPTSRADDDRNTVDVCRLALESQLV